jgi:GNAT superfamily N-acetyltransferase
MVVGRLAAGLGHLRFILTDGSCCWRTAEALFGSVHGHDDRGSSAAVVHRDMTHHIVAEHAAENNSVKALEEALYAYNREATGQVDWSPVVFCLRDQSGGLSGGLSGYVWAGWLHITMLWLHEDMRGQGFGRALLDAAEAHARALGCRDVYLNTFSFQAPEFYLAHGYRCFGQLADYPSGHTHYFMQKHLP